MPVKDAFIRATKLSKSIKKKKIFRDISFTIKKGEVVGFWGPNGSGKSTLLKILAGIEDYDSGSLDVGATTFSYLPQDPIVALLPWYSAEKNIELFFNNLKRSEISRDRIVTLLKKQGFQTKDINTRVSRLSGGYQRRLALVNLSLLNSDCILLDEPFVGLDASAIRSVLDFIRNYISGDKSVIFVTHDPELAILCADRLLIIKRGNDEISQIKEEIPIELSDRTIEVVLEEDFQRYRNIFLSKAYGV